jgi:hypothetical protein
VKARQRRSFASARHRPSYLQVDLHVLQNALLFLDGECIELAEQTQPHQKNADPAPHSSLSDIGDDAELEEIDTQLSTERGAVRPCR